MSSDSEVTMSELLGPVVRLQVHRHAVKADGVYDPSPLISVEAASFDEGGMVGWDGRAWVVDNHHRSHPEGVSTPRRALSVGFTSHYAAMEGRFGPAVVPGIAAENIVVEVDDLVPLGLMQGGIEIRAESGESVLLSEPLVAAPCREFTSHLLGLGHRAERDEIAADLEFLNAGMRGFVFGCQPAMTKVTISLGDLVYLTGP